MFTRYLTTDHWRPEKHLIACRIIREMYSDRPTVRVRTDYPALVQVNDGLEFFPATSTMPSFLVCWDASNAAIFLRGVIPGLHVSGIIGGWYDLHRATNPLGANQYLWDCAHNVILNLPFELIGGRRNWWIFGHSFGGAVGELVADQLQRGGVTNSVRLYTYGAPRPGGVVARKAIERFQPYRYFFANDLVVRNPPHSEEYPILSYFLPTQALINIDSQVQPERGYVLMPSGPMVRQELCDNGPWPYLTSFEPLLNNLFSSGNPLHFLPRYLDYWDAGVRQSVVMPPSDASVVTDEPIVMTLRDRGRQHEQFADIVIADLPNYRPTATPIEPGSATPSTTAIFRRRKVGKIWVVLLRDDVVDIGPSKRQARMKAHRWNKAIPVEQR